MRDLLTILLALGAGCTAAPDPGGLIAGGLTADAVAAPAAPPEIATAPPEACSTLEETLYVDSEIRLGDVVLGATPAVGAPLRSESYLAVYDELLLATGNSEENCGPRSAFLTVRAHPDVEPEQLAPIPYWATQAMFWVRWEPWHPEG